MHPILTFVGDGNMGQVNTGLVIYNIVSAEILSFVSFLKNLYVYLYLGVSKKVIFMCVFLYILASWRPYSNNVLGVI